MEASMDEPSLAAAYVKLLMENTDSASPLHRWGQEGWIAFIEALLQGDFAGRSVMCKLSIIASMFICLVD